MHSNQASPVEEVNPHSHNHVQPLILVNQHVDQVSRHLSSAAGSSEGPASESVGNIGSVAVGASETVVQVAVVDRSAVVHTGGRIVRTGTLVVDGGRGLGKGLLQAISRSCSVGTVLDHSVDGRIGARVDAGAVASAVVGLHEAGVANSL